MMSRRTLTGLLLAALPITLLTVLFSFNWYAGHHQPPPFDEVAKPVDKDSNSTPMTISSSAFNAGSSIPTKYTCDGEGIHPPLRFGNVPAAAKSLVLIVHDPDVPLTIKPDGNFDHWVVFNILPTTTSINEGEAVPGIEGNNGAGQVGYTGPCPPDREHRYFFQLYALDTQLSLPQGTTRAEVEKAMVGHIIEQAALMGRYERHK